MSENLPDSKIRGIELIHSQADNDSIVRDELFRPYSKFLASRLPDKLNSLLRPKLREWAQKGALAEDENVS